MKYIVRRTIIAGIWVPRMVPFFPECQQIVRAGPAQLVERLGGDYVGGGPRQAGANT